MFEHYHDPCANIHAHCGYTSKISPCAPAWPYEYPSTPLASLETTLESNLSLSVKGVLGLEDDRDIQSPVTSSSSAPTDLLRPGSRGSEGKACTSMYETPNNIQLKLHEHEEPQLHDYRGYIIMENGRIKCNCPLDKCGRNYQGLREWKRKHEPKLLPCEIPGCSMIFSRRDVMMKHMRNPNLHLRQG
ncbi:unnamed protein product [Rhizoctonia solani]|uniref:C2H2-type domain-containing protein n=1 Tax=Rhizoctonia solani TaxID=456999 RepID=A0A8H3CUY8_9AGAM|nr:unnamed protein product [Rhizoctonia solani]